MKEDKELEITRFKIIEPFLKKKKKLKEIEEEENISYATLKRWVNAYKKNGIIGLEKKSREDKNSFRNIDEDGIKKIKSVCRESGETSITKLYANCKKKFPETFSISYATFYRVVNNIDEFFNKTTVKYMEKIKKENQCYLVFDVPLYVLVDDKKVFTKDGAYDAKKIVLANGTTPRKLNIPGEAELTGKGMGMNAQRDGRKYTDKNIYVVGGADGAVKEALYLSKFAKQVTIIHFEDTLGCIEEFKNKAEQTPNIKLRLGSRLHAVYGAEQVEALEISDEKTGSVEKIADCGCGIFVYAGTTPNTELYSELELDNGFIPVDENMETNIAGVYAVGDIRVKQVRQVSTAVADGTVAGIHLAK